MTISVGYSFTGDADGACLTVYDPALREYKSETVYLGANHDGCIRAGGREGDATIALHAVPFADAAGTYTIILSARQTPAQAVNNRQPGLIKPMAQSKQTVELVPEAYDVAGPQTQLGDAFYQVVDGAAFEQGHGRDIDWETMLPCYHVPAYAPTTEKPGAVPTFWTELATQPWGIHFYMGHGWTNMVMGEDDRFLMGGNWYPVDPPTNPPTYEHRSDRNGVWYLANLPAGALRQCALIVFGGCNGANSDPYGNSLPQSALDKGAVAAAAWGSGPEYYVDFFAAFWKALMKYGSTIEQANTAGKAAVFEKYGRYGFTDTLQVSGNGAQVVRPAHFGP